ncbi:MAG: DNA repair exonuclease [Myxococcota bacterium]
MSVETPEDDDVALTLVHTADWHLGKAFAQFDGNARVTLGRARLEAVRNVFGLARQHRADAVLCAGDLFDEPHPEPRWVDALARLLDSLAADPSWGARPIYLLPGNHDPLLDGSVWHERGPLRSRLPAFCHVVDQDDFAAPLSDDAVLVARPCRSKSESKDPARALPSRAPGDERIRVGMVHGSTYTMEGYETLFPIHDDAPVERGIDYLAIGDTHSFRVLPEGRRLHPIVYPSSPEPTRFGEGESGYAALVQFRRRSRAPLVRPVRVARFTWREERVRTLDALRALAHEPLEQTVLRLVLDLCVGPPEMAEVRALLATLAGDETRGGRVAVLQLDEEGLRLDARDASTHFAAMPAVVREAAARLEAQAAAQGPDALVAERALYRLFELSRQTGALEAQGEGGP